MLKTKCILAKQDESDGIRISVMSRHTLDDGITPDSRIRPRLYTYHMDQFAPPPKLIGGYLRGEISWEQFEKEYLKHIRSPKMEIHRRALISLAFYSTATLMCIEENPERCHRRLLAEEMKRISPKEIDITIE